MNIIYWSIMETILIIIAGLIVAVGFSAFLDFITRENKALNVEMEQKTKKGGE